MKWVNVNAKIPIDQKNFWEIIDAFVFCCPSSIKRKETYRDVSARKCSFRARGINGKLLTSLVAKLKQPFVKNGTYAVLKHSSDNVESRVQQIMKSVSLGDSNYDLMVFKHRHDMPITEAIYYYIRNAFAHGSFEVKNNNGSYIYLLECSNKKQIVARMRIKEKTLLEIAKLSKLSAKELKSKRNSR